MDGVQSSMKWELVVYVGKWELVVLVGYQVKGTSK